MCQPTSELQFNLFVQSSKAHIKVSHHDLFCARVLAIQFSNPFGCINLSKPDKGHIRHLGKHVNDMTVFRRDILMTRHVYQEMVWEPREIWAGANPTRNEKAIWSECLGHRIYTRCPGAKVIAIKEITNLLECTAGTMSHIASVIGEVRTISRLLHNTSAINTRHSPVINVKRRQESLANCLRNSSSTYTIMWWRVGEHPPKSSVIVEGLRPDVNYLALWSCHSHRTGRVKPKRLLQHLDDQRCHIVKCMTCKILDDCLLLAMEYSCYLLS